MSQSTYSALALNSALAAIHAYNVGMSVDDAKKIAGNHSIVKLGSNENPYGASPKVHAAMQKGLSELHIYPDSSCHQVRYSLAKRLQTSADNIVLGNGSEDLIAVAMRVLLNQHTTMLTVNPAFGLHTIHAQAMGAKIVSVDFTESYEFDVPELLAQLHKRPALLCLSLPSNPVGSYIKEAAFRQLLAACGQQTVLLLDEAYHEYGCLASDYPDYLGILRASTTRFLLLRTFSKAYGLAALRVGYGIASDHDLAEWLNRLRTPFNVSAVAQSAAIAALDDEAFSTSSCQQVVRGRQIMQAELTALGLFCAPSVANFLFVNVRQNAKQFAQSLLAFGVIVKPWDTPANDHFIRISIGTPEQNQQCLAAIKQIYR